MEWRNLKPSENVVVSQPGILQGLNEVDIRRSATSGEIVEIVPSSLNSVCILANAAETLSNDESNPQEPDIVASVVNRIMGAIPDEYIWPPFRSPNSLSDYVFDISDGNEGPTIRDLPPPIFYSNADLSKKAQQGCRELQEAFFQFAAEAGLAIERKKVETPDILRETLQLPDTYTYFTASPAP